MKKAMLSQPMAGKTDEEIVATRERAIKALEARGYEVVNTLFTDECIVQKAWRIEAWRIYRFAFLLSLSKICLCAMRPISAKDGRMQEDADWSMMQR